MRLALLGHNQLTKRMKHNCEPVGVSLAANVGLFGEGFYAGACELAIEAVANIEELRGIDDRAQVNMLIAGVASAKDPSGDSKADQLTMRSGANKTIGSGLPVSSSERRRITRNSMKKSQKATA